MYMVMEFVEHDLKFVLEQQAAKKAPPFSIGQVWCIYREIREEGRVGAGGRDSSAPPLLSV